jgi:hypothetical protein
MASLMTSFWVSWMVPLMALLDLIDDSLPGIAEGFYTASCQAILDGFFDVILLGLLDGYLLRLVEGFFNGTFLGWFLLWHLARLASGFRGLLKWYLAGLLRWFL